MRPHPRRLGASQVCTRPQALGHAALLAEQVVGDLGTTLGREQACLAGGEHGEGGVRAVVHGARGDAEQLGDLGVALALTQQQRERRALVWRELVQSAHGL